MSDVPNADHYAAALRCLDAAQLDDNTHMLLAALVHAVLSTAPPALAYDAYNPPKKGQAQ